MIELYWKDETHQEYGILVSPGYGCGWSSWNTIRLAYDRKVIEYWLTHKDSAFTEITAWLEQNGYPNVYVSYSNWHNLVLEWIPVGMRWRVREYDGSETIEKLNLASYICFDKNGEPV